MSPRPSLPARRRAARPSRPAARLRPQLHHLESRDLPAVTVTVDAAADRHAINQLIYGTAYADTAALNDLNLPLNRWGGNTTSTYNWQQNASNHANDFYFESIADGPATAGGAADDFIQSTRNGGAAPNLTIPTLGWVAKLGANRSKLASFSIGKYGNQTGNDWQYFPDAGNGQHVADATHPNAYPITTNDKNDANVPADANFQLGWVQHLIGKWGNANSGGVRYYTLDNEPAIWYETHQDTHPDGPSMAEIRDKIETYATMIHAQDPNAVILGPEEFGWAGYFFSGKDLQYGNATGDWGNVPDRKANGGADYLPWVLDQLRQYDQAHGTHSLNVFTVHYYPQSGEFNPQGDDLSNAMQLLRNRSTRSLWDPTYKDESWIGDAGPDNGIVRLIPRLKQWVNTYYPGLQTGITEYNWGAEGHMNGATTQADILGIFGREGLDLADRWTTPAAGSPAYLAMKMYRNYDGSKSTFGQTSVRDTVPDPNTVSSFAAVRADGALTVMVINKNLYDPAQQGATTQITLNLSNFAHGTAAQLWQLAATNPANQTVAAISRKADVTFSADSLSFNAPMQSVLLFVIPPAATNTATTTALTSSANPSAAGDAVTFTATVTGGTSGTPTGSVTFKDGANTLGTVTLNAAGVATYTTSALTAGTHSITAVYGGGGGFAGSTSAPLNQNVVTRPAVAGSQVDDGSAQRSMVRSLAVVFTKLVTFDAGAFTVVRSDGLTVTPTVGVTTVGSQTSVLLTFGSPTTSLADGNWKLTVVASKVHDAGSPSITMAADYTLNFFRFFGDSNGDRKVDAVDLFAFAGSFGKRRGDSGYLDYFDSNGDGVVDALDLFAFAGNFGKILP